jgi:serine/threonine-protein kinase
MAIDDELLAALPDYDVEREIGRGGMGIVFLGKHARLGRRVAIKELPHSFASDPAVRERFSTEARTLASLAHPHVVPIYDYVERDGLCLIVMEELPGGTVWDRFTSSGLTAPTACAIVLACCAALQHAHEQGVLHLDVKPDNLMFATSAAIKVTDFGIARVVTGDRTLGTLDGQVLGTPAYMSPEQARGADLTKASDVYSTGVMLYELLSGRLPWTGAETATDLLLKRLREEPIPLREQAPHVPVAVASVVMKAIEREPGDRYASAEDFGIALASACADSWGIDWLDAAGIVIIGSDRLSLAARTTGRQAVTSLDETRISGGASVAPMTAVGDVVPETHARETSAAAAASEGPTAAPAAPPPAPSGPSEFEVVRPVGMEPRIQGADLNNIDMNALVDVSDVIGGRASRRLPLIAAVLLLVAALVAALALFEAPSRDGNLNPGDVTIGGVDVAAGDTVRLDTSENLRVVANLPVLKFATTARLEFSVAGMPVGSASTDLAGGVGEIDTGGLRYLTAGNVAGRLELGTDSEQLAFEEFPADVDRPWYLTAMGIGSVLVMLAGFAYFESAIRPLRRARRRVAAYVGCAVSSAVFALGLVLLLTSMGRANPTAPGLAAVAALVALSGLALGESVRRAALRKSAQRAIRRAERSFARA